MKPFLLGKKSNDLLAAKAPVSAAPAPLRAAVGTTRGDAAALHGPHIEVVKEGDKVVRLVITCACGEHMEVECIYPVGA